MKRMNPKTPSLLLFLVLLFQTIVECKSQALWAKQIGGADGEIASCTSPDLFGNIYTSGTFSGTSTFGTYILNSAGKGDVFITKSNASNGDIVWVKQFGSGNEDNGTSVTCDLAGNIYCTGRFAGTVTFGTFTLNSVGSSDVFFIKIDPATGSVIWATRSGGTGFDSGLSLTSDASGNIYASGFFQGTATFGTSTLSPVGTNLNTFLIKVDYTTGAPLWAKGYGSSGYTYGTSIACDVSGDVYLTGNFEGVVIFGSDTLVAQQYQDIFVSKHSTASGDALWAKAMGGPGNDTGNGITMNTDGSVYVTGKFEGISVFGTSTLTSEGSADAFVIKADPASGSIVWIKQLGDQGYEQANSITHDASGNLFITGQYNGIINFDTLSFTSKGNADIFIVKMSPATKSILWAASMGGNSVDSGYNISGDANGNVYCTGSFQGNADLQNYALSAKGTNDIFIVKMNGLTVNLNENPLIENLIQLRPNPFNEKLTLSFITNITESVEVEIRDIMGKTVFFTSSNDTQLVLELSDLASGVYFLSLIRKNGYSEIKKIIKE